MERKSLPVTPVSSRNTSPTKTPRRDACAELPTLNNPSPLRQRITRSSGQFFKRLTASLFEDAPLPRQSAEVLIKAHPVTENERAPEEAHTPKTERRRVDGHGLRKTSSVQQPKRLTKALRSFVLAKHAERALKLAQQEPPSLAQLQGQIGEEIEGLKLKIDRLKAQQTDYEKPSPLRRDGPITIAVEALLQPVVERQVLEQCVQAIPVSAEPWPTQVGGGKLDLTQLSPEQLTQLCNTIAGQTVVAQRLLHNLPDGFAHMGATVLAHMNEAFPDNAEANFRVIAGGLVFRSLMGPFNAMFAAALGAKPAGGEKSGKGKLADLSELAPCISFCNELLASFVNGVAIGGLEAMPAELQKAITAAGEAIAADMKRVVTPTGL